MGDDDYRQVWQTWKLVRPKSQVAVSESTAEVTTVTYEVRFKVQQSRIDQHLSISDLAARIPHCDAQTLAAFEGGTGVLSEIMMRDLCKILNIVR